MTAARSLASSSESDEESDEVILTEVISEPLLLLENPANLLTKQTYLFS